MEFVSVSKDEKIATVTLKRGKVNALNDQVVEEMTACFRELAEDPNVCCVIMTGTGSFFSFGFDIPQFFDYSKEAFTHYLTNFTNLYTEIFLFPKPVIAALNGHTMAGGCMLATAADYRLMVTGKAKISLNEVNIGSSLMAGSLQMLKVCVGRRAAHTIVMTGDMYTCDQAFDLGLVDEKATVESLTQLAWDKAREFAAKDPAAFQSIKKQLREPVGIKMRNREAESIREFVEIWYSEETRKRLSKIKIRV